MLVVTWLAVIALMSLGGSGRWGVTGAAQLGGKGWAGRVRLVGQSFYRFYCAGGTCVAQGCRVAAGST